LENIISTKDKHNILEIGCFEGLSSVFFANFLEHSESSLTCVDPFLHISNNDHERWLNDVEKRFDHNICLSKYPEKIKVHKIASDLFFEMNTETYDFIYIDGCHLPDYIQRDMENSIKFLEKGGIIWMDDYLGDDGIVIKKAIDDILSKFDEKYELVHSGYQLAFRLKQ
jgi:predicted O-methyltransferase YrrM